MFSVRPCPFLEGSRCTVYSDRPQSCAGYPFIGNGFRSRLLMHLSNAELCPITFNVLERLKARTGWHGRRRRRGRP